MTEGWRCPDCESVYAPWVAQCTRCPLTTFSTAASPVTLLYREDIPGLIDLWMTTARACAA